MTSTSWVVADTLFMPSGKYDEETDEEAEEEVSVEAAETDSDDADGAADDGVNDGDGKSAVLILWRGYHIGVSCLARGDAARAGSGAGIFNEAVGDIVAVDAIP